MAEKTIKARVMRDFWRSADDRVRAGTVVEVPVESLLEGMESGILERVKDDK